jgi:hypothetical protein
VTGRAVQGYCLMGCGQTLFLGTGGYVTCGNIPCPRPTAVTDLLNDAETEHIVEFGDRTFTVRHPLRERLDDALMTCALHEWIADRDGPPVQPGRYRAVKRSGLPGRWVFTQVDEVSRRSADPGGPA